MPSQTVKLLLIIAGMLALGGCVMPSDYGYVRPDGGYYNAPGGYYVGEGYDNGYYDNGYYGDDGYYGGYYGNCAGGCGSVSIGVGYGYGYPGYGYGYGYPYYGGGYYDYHHHRHDDGDHDGDDHDGHGHWSHGHGGGHDDSDSGGFDRGAHGGHGNVPWRDPGPVPAPHGGERSHQSANGNGFPQARFDQPRMPERGAFTPPNFARPAPVMRAEHAMPAPSRHRDTRIDQQ